MNQPLSRPPEQLSDHQRKFGTLQQDCPVQAALDILRGRWKPSILFELKAHCRRYSELQRALPRISAQALTTQLKQLEADGLIERQVYAEVPVRVEYRLSEFGASLSEVMDSLESWGSSYLAYRKDHL
ncbi:winged helix-turn-helix transcriptional regulator [Lacimicrobium alkaliphilum]|uniref:winged helix-turn-helix transcriptional regulator n=1 Tax=Lacimicrobium alkaliphilum TaxID=1526571 RepID=UPI0009EBE589|nr:helix-turn-helix domain-containing protein [Lacimicrobium alkaliphilum]